jgi:hypothetical protein
MANLGMLMLGVFVGTFLTLGIGVIDSQDSWAKMVGTVLGAAFGGVVMVFIDKWSTEPIGNAKYMYPVGLALMVPWFYMKQVMELVRSPDELIRGIGKLGLGAIAVFTVAVAILVIPHAFKEAWQSAPQGVPQAVPPAVPPPT